MFFQCLLCWFTYSGPDGQERGEGKNVCMVGLRKAEEKTREGQSKGGQRGGEGERE